MTFPFLRRSVPLAAVLLFIGFNAWAGGAPVFETPDRVNLLQAAHALKKGFYESAVSNFEESARLGNKDAQKTLGMMYIKGTGVEMNWPRGYAWLKLAATHGDPESASARDQVYAQLKDEEKPLAEKWVLDVYEEFGDQAAVERREAWVRKEKRKITGSRTGKSGAVRVEVADATGYKWQVSGARYFDLLKGDYILEFRQHMGEVEIGELELVDD